MSDPTTTFTALDDRRRRLGMSQATLANLSGISLPTVSRILSGAEDAPKLTSLRAIATALRVVIQVGEEMTIQPLIDEDRLREEQATIKARHVVGMVQATMALEAQAVSPNVIEQMVRQTVHELLAGSGRRLWDE